MSKNVKCEHLPSGKIRLIRDFGEVPRNFVCDGASVPRLLWRLFGHPYDKRHIRAGVRHDWRYHVGGDEKMRKAVDEQYREDLKADGQRFVLRWLEYFAVRLCGRSHFNQQQKKAKTNMKKLIMLAACAAIVAGCGTPGKVRDIDLKGMYINGYTETLAIGQGRMTSIPGEREALAAHYEEDTAWLSPSTKTHRLDIFLVGSNSVSSSEKIISSICQAFTDVAPTVSSNNAAKATGATAFDALTAAGAKNAEVEAAKIAAAKVAAEALANTGKDAAAASGGDASAATEQATDAAPEQAEAK